MSFKSDLEALVLAALGGERLHGYELAKRIASRSGGALKIGEGQLYPTLHKLEERGMVTAEWVPQEGKPSRKTYALTESGVAELAEKKSAWERFVASVGAVMATPKEVHGG
jgi:PadR family transcriptional regulator, regulatory protein PadR